MDAKNFLKAIEREAIVAYTNKKGVIEYVNSNFCRISGYSAKELMGKDHRILNSGYHPKSFFIDIWSTILSGNVWVGDICNRAKDGSLYWVNSTISPSIVDGEIAGFYAVRNDVTRQKELEQRNLDLTRLSNDLQRIAQIGGWTYILESKKFITTGQMLTILGIPKTLEIRPCDIDELIPENTSNLFSGLINRALEDEGNITENFKIISLKGIVLCVKVTASLIKDDEGRPIKVVGTLHDISELEEAQEKVELERRKSIHSAKLASIGEMASSVVHEMNNPLTIIQGNVRSTQRLSTLPEIQDRIKKLERPIEKLVKLADNLRKYSRGSMIGINLKSYDLKNLIEESLVFLEYRLTYANIELTLDLEEGLEIKCDRSELEQVIVNLVNNSVDAIEKHITRWIKIEAHQIGDKITLSFTDSGDGIPKKIQNKIFDTFYTTKSAEKGTGLGLGIVKDILLHHNADIRVDDTSPNTKFVIEFEKFI